MMTSIPYRRVLLKLSGETLLGKRSFGISQHACVDIANALHQINLAGLQLAVVIGGGNIFRGIDLKHSGIQQTPADHMGMLATLMNGIALQEALRNLGSIASVMSALECPKV